MSISRIVFYEPKSRHNKLILTHSEFPNKKNRTKERRNRDQKQKEPYKIRDRKPVSKTTTSHLTCRHPGDPERAVIPWFRKFSGSQPQKRVSTSFPTPFKFLTLSTKKVDNDDVSHNLIQ